MLKIEVCLYMTISFLYRIYAFQRMKDAGAYVTTSESMLLALVGGASHPRFKQIQKIIMTSAPDTGLLTTINGETAVW